MKMKHFMTEEWIDFVNQVSSPKQQEAMKKHWVQVAGDSRRSCYVAKGSQRGVQSRSAIRPPAGRATIAKATFRFGRAAKQRKAKAAVDSAVDSLHRARSAVWDDMLYRADPYQIDIQIEAKPEGNRLMVQVNSWMSVQPGIVAAMCR